MSFQTFVTEQLALLNGRYNAITTNAKKIDELPAQSTLFPGSKIHVSKNGDSAYITIQQIINSVTNNLYDQIISIGTITIASGSITIPLNAIWKIANIIYQTSSNTVISIPFCTTGLSRIDVIVANTSNQIVRIAGAETLGLAIRPNIPINTILVTEISVSDSVISNPTPPVTIDLTASHYRGKFNALTNALPYLTDGIGQNGDYYEVVVAGSVDFGNGIIPLFVGDYIHYSTFTGRYTKWISATSSSSSTITKTQLTYTSSTIFTIPQNSQILSVIIGELRHLSAPKYTYNPLLATNNFEITDPTFLADIEAGTTIEITTI